MLEIGRFGNGKNNGHPPYENSPEGILLTNEFTILSEGSNKYLRIIVNWQTSGVSPFLINRLKSFLN